MLVLRLYCCRGLAVEDFPLLLLSVAEYVAVRRGLLNKSDALGSKRTEVGGIAARSHVYGLTV